METTVSDRRRIREAIENWAVHRDLANWDALSAFWTEDARVHTLWLAASATHYLELARLSHEKGALSHHFIGASLIKVSGDRAVAQTQLRIDVRTTVIGGVLCDIAATARFYDLFVRRADRWLILERHVIYEKDRIDPVDPQTRVTLDPAVLQRMPLSCMHLAYLQTVTGKKVRRDGHPYEASVARPLYARGEAWLFGGSLPLD